MTTVNDFEVAKAVVDLLKDLNQDQQARILRWVSESLEIVVARETHVEAPAPHGRNQGMDRMPAPGSATDIKSFVGHKIPRATINLPQRLPISTASRRH